MTSNTVCLIGDSIYDEYIHCEALKMSNEYPGVVYREYFREVRKGGALNVESNLIALGLNVKTYTCNIEKACIKTRYVVDNKVVYRCDKDILSDPIDMFTIDDHCDWVVLSDYAKGVLSNVKNLIAHLANKNKKIVVDLKRDLSHYARSYCVKMNEVEYDCYVQKGYSLSELRRMYDIDILIVTLGSKGCIVSYDDVDQYEVKAEQCDVCDVTGAGDVFLSVLTYCFMKNIDIISSVRYAVQLASLSVTKFGTHVLTPEEISSVINRGIVVFTNGCFDLLHRGHVEYLKKSRALGDRLIVAINSDDSIRRNKGKNRPIIPQEDRKYMLESYSFVDEVIIFDEDTPYELIRKIKPNIITKGFDYQNKYVVGSDMCKVVLIPYLDGYSTSNICERIKS